MKVICGNGQGSVFQGGAAQVPGTSEVPGTLALLAAHVDDGYFYAVGKVIPCDNRDTGIVDE